MSSHRLPASKAREKFADVLNAVSVKGDRVLLHRHGKNVAALISAQDLELLEALEDKYDVDLAREALAESDERIPWDKVKADLAL
jgi:prevent-host-death family protein